MVLRRNGNGVRRSVMRFRQRAIMGERDLTRQVRGVEDQVIMRGRAVTKSLLGGFRVLGNVRPGLDLK